jgi:hypothetical protein
MLFTLKSWRSSRFVYSESTRVRDKGTNPSPTSVFPALYAVGSFPTYSLFSVDHERRIFFVFTRGGCLSKHSVGCPGIVAIDSPRNCALAHGRNESNRLYFGGFSRCVYVCTCFAQAAGRSCGSGGRNRFVVTCCCHRCCENLMQQNEIPDRS